MALVDDLRAIGAFLDGAQKYPATYEAAKSHQLQVALSLASREARTPTQAADAMTLLQQQSVWSDAERNEIVTALQQGMARRSAPVVPGQRLSQQDFTHICAFFPKPMWDYMQLDTESVANKAMKVTAFGTQLGLRNPTEGTFAFLTSLMLHLPGCTLFKQSSADLHDSYVVVKKWSRSVLITAPSLPAHLPFVDRLPSRWQDLDPRWLEIALEGQQPVKEPPGLSLAQVLAFASTIPQRSSNRSLQRPMNATNGGSECLLGLLRGLVNGMVDKDPRPGDLKNMHIFDHPRHLGLACFPRSVYVYVQLHENNGKTFLH